MTFRRLNRFCNTSIWFPGYSIAYIGWNWSKMKVFYSQTLMAAIVRIFWNIGLIITLIHSHDYVNKSKRSSNMFLPTYHSSNLLCFHGYQLQNWTNSYHAHILVLYNSQSRSHSRPFPFHRAFDRSNNCSLRFHLFSYTLMMKVSEAGILCTMSGDFVERAWHFGYPYMDL